MRLESNYQPTYTIIPEILNRVPTISKATGRPTVLTDQAKASLDRADQRWRRTMSERQKYHRYHWLHGQIRAGRYPNSGHLAREFEISVRSAHRTIEDMRLYYNAPLVYDHGKKGYCYSNEAFELPGHWISEPNILALALAIRLASTLPNPGLKDDLNRLIERLAEAMSRSDRVHLGRIDELVSVKNIEYARVDADIFRRIVEALFAGRAITLDYHSPHSGQATRRTIQPLHLLHYLGSWYLLGWCATRQALRNFALARVQRLEQASEPLVLPTDLPPIKAYTRRHFGIMHGDISHRVTLAISPKIAPLVREQVWHPEQIITPTADNGLLLTFAAADFRELVRVILGFGAEVRVLAPVELRQLIEEEIDALHKLYSNPDTP